MKLFFTISFLLYLTFFNGCAQRKNEHENNNTTKYILVRHAEKDSSNPSNKNPDLTPEGIDRAKNLATLFKGTKIDFVFSTDLKRTLHTVTPIAKNKKLEIITYIPFKLYTDAFKKKTESKTTIIVGHSNTIPDLVNKIIGKQKYPNIHENEYDNLYMITIKGDVITDHLESYN